MIASVDVAYPDAGAVAACVVCRDWTDEAAAARYVEPIAAVRPYQPGLPWRTAFDSSSKATRSTYR